MPPRVADATLYVGSAAEYVGAPQETVRDPFWQPDTLAELEPSDCGVSEPRVAADAATAPVASTPAPIAKATR